MKTKKRMSKQKWIIENTGNITNINEELINEELIKEIPLHEFLAQ